MAREEWVLRFRAFRGAVLYTRRWRHALVAWIGLSTCTLIQAEGLKLATGEFPPYVGAALPGFGVSSQIVQEAFRAAGYRTTLVFMPWRRAAAQTASGQYDGSYPWAMNRARLRQFIYSQALYQDEIRFFARLGGGLEDERNWYGKSLCIPLGWDVSQVQVLITRYRFALEQPSQIENCFRMIEAGRVALTAVNRQVGERLVEQLQLRHPIGPVGAAVAKDKNYLIVSRTHPKATQLIDAFNRGLEQIRRDGRYRQILEKTTLQSR